MAGFQVEGLDVKHGDKLRVWLEISVAKVLRCMIITTPREGCGMYGEEVTLVLDSWRDFSVGSWICKTSFLHQRLYLALSRAESSYLVQCKDQTKLSDDSIQLVEAK